MSLVETIRHDTEAAMKSRDAGRLDTLRMLRSALKNLAIEKRRELEDDEVVATIRTEVKRLRDSENDFRAGGRIDLVNKIEAELVVLNTYLPALMSEDGVREVVSAKLEESGRDPKQMGKLMGEIMAVYKGKMDGGMLARVMKEEMAEKSQ